MPSLGMDINRGHDDICLYKDTKGSIAIAKTGNIPNDHKQENTENYNE